MSEKLCLKWNDFKENVMNTFASLREDKDLVDVTLVCEDGDQLELHKVVLANSSPIFQNILRKNRNTQPLIFMRGVKSKDLIAIVDFLYYGEANVLQENLDSFLALADDLQLKGLKGPDIEQEPEEASVSPTEARKNKPKPQMIPNSEILPNLPNENSKAASVKRNSNVIATTAHYKEDFYQLDEIVMSMMETSENKISLGGRMKSAKMCKVCGKQGQKIDIKRHIEANHLEGVSIPCKQCAQTFRSRDALRCHVSSRHKHQ